MNLVKFDEIEKQIDIERDLQELAKIYNQIDLYLDYLKKQKDGSVVVINKGQKYKIKAEMQIGDIYKNLNKEKGGRSLENSLPIETSSQQAEQDIGKSRKTQYDDILIETKQDVETDNQGWIEYITADWLIYLFWDFNNKKPYNVFSINIKKLKPWVKERLYIKPIVSTKGWGKTIFVCYPIEQLMYYKRCKQIYFQSEKYKIDMENSIWNYDKIPF